MKALHGSGGSTKGAGIIGAWNALKAAGYHPDIISGVSVSAILAVPFALGKGEQAAEMMKTLDLDMFWSKKPVKDNGKFSISALIRLIRGKSLGDQAKLKKTLSKIVTYVDFLRYKDRTYPDVIIMSVDFNTGSRVFTNMKKVTYDEFLNLVLASASIPVYAMPVFFGKMRLYDGGVRDHIISHYVNEKYPVKESISIYSREEGLGSLDTDVSAEGIQGWDPKNYHFDALSRSTEIMTYEISRGDEEREIKISRQKGIKNLQIFLPKVLNSLYDVNNNRLKELHDLSSELATKKYQEWKR